MAIKRIVIVGGGPSGMMAAIRASQLQQETVLLERNSSLGKKLLLSGKGRCNLTNACGLELFLKRFSKNGPFLRDAFKKFFNQDLMNFFETRGLKLKVERQLRVFPSTDSSVSILQVLKEELAHNRVTLMYNTKAESIAINEKRAQGVFIAGKKLLPADRVILATGGVSYSFTGSHGDGLRFARESGHRLVKQRPGLVPLKVAQPYVGALEGLTLKNIRLRFSDGKKEIPSEVGEVLFTRSGISGPLVLTLSGEVVDLLLEGKKVFVEIDCKPGLTVEALTARLLREFTLHAKMSVKRVMKELLPERLIDRCLKEVVIEPLKKVSQLTKEERQRLVSFLKGWRLDILMTLSLEEGMVTRGGVSLKDINPRTMESRLIQGLYFAGELIDVDADTGGFNLQAAFSTGYLAGESAAV